MCPREDARRPRAVLVTCEHAGRRVPSFLRAHFAGAEEVLRSHRGHDAGAHAVAVRLAERLCAPLLPVRASRLVIDPNRSLGRPDSFSELTRDLPEDVRRRIVATVYAPHRAAARAWLAALAEAAEPVVHIGVHSFVDELDGRVRDVDIGLLFDPDRPFEAGLTEAWGDRIAARRPDLRVRFNEPYLGTDDGLTASMRAELPRDLYAGLEVEVRQGMLARPEVRLETADLLAETLLPSLDLELELELD